MWRQSLAEKKGVSPSEALSPDQTPSVAPCASSLSMFSFRLCDVSAVDGKAGSGDEARFFRREVRDEGGTDVDGHHAVEVFETISVDCAPGENARVADEDIKRAEGFRCSGHSGAELFGRGAVGF